MHYQLQRNVQLVKAAQKMLQSPIRAWRPPDASWNQALTAVWCILLFPDLFHAAFSTAAPGSGARLIVLQPGVSETDIGPPPKELDSAGSPFDYGTGGMALATHARPPGDSGVDLYVGSVAFFAANQQHKGPQSPSTPADPMVSVIAAIRYTGSASFSGSTLVETQRLVLDGGAANRPRVYGVCGIAVGDVVPGNNLQEIVVTSLDGHVLVYERDDSGTFGPLVYQTMVEGSVGAFNSIVIADLDNSGQNELYVAGSLGIRKFIPNPLP